MSQEPSPITRAGIDTVRVGVPSDDTTSAADAASVYPLTIDNCGEQVTLDQRPERIFTSGTTPVNLPIGVGAVDTIVGWSGEFGQSLVGAVGEAVTDVPVVMPDRPAAELVIGSGVDLYFSDPPNLSTIRPQLDAAGVNALSTCNYKTFDQVWASLELLGRMMGTEAQTHTLVEGLRQRLEAVHSNPDRIATQLWCRCSRTPSFLMDSLLKRAHDLLDEQGLCDEPELRGRRRPLECRRDPIGRTAGLRSDLMLVRVRHVAVAGLVGVSVLTVSCSSDGDEGDGATTRSSSDNGAAPESSEGSASGSVVEYDVPQGSRPHDVAVAEDGTVWYTAQGSGELGRLFPDSGEIEEIALGSGSRPHGVIIGPDGAPWITDGGLNAIVRVDPATTEVETFPLPASENANLNTAVFDRDGTLWFTGQAGIYGRLTAGGEVEVFDAPRGQGPYGISATPDGGIYYASLAGNYLGRIDPATGESTVIEPPTAEQGTRRVWVDSRGRLWTSQWNAGQVAVYDPATERWQEWRLPGDNPQAYAVYVDDRDHVWLSDFGANALVELDPDTEEFTSYPLPSQPGEVRQIHGRPGEVWGAESAADEFVVVRIA
jgi:virginiamycin B lyase